jgi:uncharacterized protein YbaR (Trm112 family)
MHDMATDITDFPEWALQLLRCPITHEELVPADRELVQKLQALQRAGRLMNRLGVPSEQQFSAGLLNQSKTLFYPMHRGIPTLIPGEAVALN